MNCCKEECFDDNTHACSWRDANLGRIFVVDEACPDGFSRCYQGSNPNPSPTPKPDPDPIRLSLTLTL